MARAYRVGMPTEEEPCVAGTSRGAHADVRELSPSRRSLFAPEQTTEEPLLEVPEETELPEKRSIGKEQQVIDR
jgi:hypothetical protein